MNFHKLYKWHEQHKESQLYGRHIRPKDIAPLFKKYSTYFKVEPVGNSVEQREIKSIEVGTGPIKILVWSQMHGNESTTTKAVFDLLKYFSSNSEKTVTLLQQITLVCIPMLNPDGAIRYTRLNANEKDLNRDAQDLSQPESQILKKIYTQLEPDFCLNLHGQRTIFGVGTPAKSAVVSLLYPSQDAQRTVTEARRAGMAIIVDIQQMLEEFIPGAVGRYDDAYNINCVGDSLQSLNIPTILFEAGHYPKDYMREETRRLLFLALVKTITSITAATKMLHNPEGNYHKIPENKKCFFDYIIRNVAMTDRGIVDVAIQFEEKLVEKQLKFIPKVQKIGDLSAFFGHSEHDLSGQKILQESENQCKEGAILREILVNKDKAITFSVN